MPKSCRNTPLHKSYPLGLIVGACVLASSACTGSGTIAASGCLPNEVLYNGACAQICVTNQDCGTEEVCVDDKVCQTAGADVLANIPTIVGINGNGSADGATGHTANRLATGVVLTGTNLSHAAADFTVTLVDEVGVTTDLTGLVVASDSSSLTLGLPTDIASNTRYTIRVANQFGSDQTTVLVLQGEAGDNGAAGQNAVCTADCGESTPNTQRQTTIELRAVNPLNPTLKAHVQIDTGGATNIVNTGPSTEVPGIIVALLNRKSTADGAHAIPTSPVSQIFYGDVDALVTMLGLITTGDTLVAMATYGDISAMSNGANVQNLYDVLIAMGAPVAIQNLTSGEGFVFLGYRNIGRNAAVFAKIDANDPTFDLDGDGPGTDMGRSVATRQLLANELLVGTHTGQFASTSSLAITGGAADVGDANDAAELAVVHDATVGGTLDVTGNATVGGTLGVTSNATVGGTLGVTSNATVGGTLGVTGNATVGGTLGVSGALTAASLDAGSGAVSTTGALSGGSLTVANPTSDAAAATLAFTGGSGSHAGGVVVRSSNDAADTDVLFDVRDDTTSRLAVLGNGNVNVGGNITVGGTVDGIDIAALNTTVGNKLNTSTYNAQVNQALLTTSEVNFGAVSVSAGGPSRTKTYFALTDAGAVGSFTATGGYAMYTEGGLIGAAHFYAHSDRRIKENIKPLSAAESLEVINALDVVTYNYKDRLQKGSDTHYGFIAQEAAEVRDVFVNETTEWVPSIYTKAASSELEEGHLTITLDTPHGLKVGDEVRLWREAKSTEAKVLEVDDAYSFTIPWTQPEHDRLFVWGTKVDDYSSIVHDEVYAVGVKALQELSRQVSELQDEVARLKKQLR